ncbi:MAG: transcriptional regulator of acetoin/glycerol metabolism [Planctomycetota bacterium]|jgi:transcriptional regulator of acetoin/glycerol metabolism
MSRVLLIGCDPADAAIIGSNLLQARHQASIHDLDEPGIDEVLAYPWDAIVTPSRGPSGTFVTQLADRVSSQPWRATASLLVFESPAQEPDAGKDAFISGADQFVDRAHIEALVPALESSLRQARRLAEGAEHMRNAASALRTPEVISDEELTPHVPAIEEEPCGCLVVNGHGDVIASDLRSGQLLGHEPGGWSLGDLAPAGALLVPFRRARHTQSQGEPFETSPKRAGCTLTLRSTFIPVGGGNTIVLLHQLNPNQSRSVAPGPGLPATWMQTIARARRSLGASRVFSSSAAGRKLRGEVREHAQSRTPLTIAGEIGVGRSSIARCVHFENPMAGRLVEIRATAFSDVGLERELFGPRGALASLSLADTLLIDHIECMPSVLQQRLAACMNPSNHTYLKARLMVTTNVDMEGILPELTAALGFTVLRVPSLRQRQEDIPDLAREVLIASGFTQPLPTIDAAAMNLLQRAELAENLEDLERALRSAIQAADGETIGVEHLPTELSSGSRMEAKEWCDAPWSITDDDPISLDVYERKVILRALASCRGDKVAAAQLLEVGRSTLYRKLRHLGLD